MRYKDPSWWQVAALYVISGMAFLPPMSATRILAGVTMVAIVTVLVIVKVVHRRSPQSASRPPRT